MKIPFNPSVYEHAARFAGCTPWEASRDPELLFQGHRDAWLEYRHTPIVLGIDIYNLEPEAYGAPVHDPGPDGIPAIQHPLFASLDDALEVPPFDPARDGRIAMVLDTGKRLRAALPEADVRIPVAGPFSIAFNLLGITPLCENVGLRPADTAPVDAPRRESSVFTRAIIDAARCRLFLNPPPRPLPPRQFRAVELPAHPHSRPPPPSLTTPFRASWAAILSKLTTCSPPAPVMSSVRRNPPAALRGPTPATHPHVNVRINMDPLVVACHDAARIHAEVDRILAIAAGRPNCLMGTGCLPLETPPSNIRLIREYLA